MTKKWSDNDAYQKDEPLQTVSSSRSHFIPFWTLLNGSNSDQITITIFLYSILEDLINLKHYSSTRHRFGTE